MSIPRRARTAGLLLAPVLVLAAPTLTGAAAADDAPPAAPTGCDALVTHAPDGSEGDRAAVAITSQVLVADVDGWDQVTWEADPQVRIDAVVVHTADGATVSDGGASGQAGPATALTFCGEATDTGSPDPAAGAGGDEADALALGGLATSGRSLLGSLVGAVVAALVLLRSHGARHAARRPGRHRRQAFA